MTAERLRERGAAQGAWEALGGNSTRLIKLDGHVRSGARSDWPDRPAWLPEVRTDPLLWWGDRGPGEYKRLELRPR